MCTLCIAVHIMAHGVGQDLGQQVALFDLADTKHKWKLAAVCGREATQ